jgi:guanine nucleotide-binding protein G(i) subunit alpha
MGNTIGRRLKEEDKQRKLKDKDKGKGKADNGTENDKEKVAKIVMLGTGECGKSTLFRQMVCLHGTGFKTEFRTTYRAAIYEACIEAAHSIIRALNNEFAKDSEVKVTNDEILKTIETVKVFSKHQNMDRNVAGSLANFWSIDTIKLALWKSKSPLLASKESIAFFFDNLERISNPDYLPSDEDLIMMRVRTTGLVREDFQIGAVKFALHDTGGQRNERKKWIHLFDGVTAILYVASLSEYDEVCFEDEKTNRGLENLECFEQYMNGSYLAKVPVILVFTKTDIFEKKFTKSPVSSYFPEFEGTTTEEAREFFKKLYLQQIKGHTDQEPRQVFVHYVNATDPESCIALFNSIKDDINIIQECLMNSPFL